MRKETIERIFGTIKEHHGFRYTLMKGKAKMEMKSLITFTCINMKKLVKILARKTSDIFDILINPLNFVKYLFANKKPGYIYIFNPVCLWSAANIKHISDFVFIFNF